MGDFMNIVPPSDDKRWKIVDATMRRNGYSSDALIETLHTVQNSFGFLGDEALLYVAESLRVSLSKVYGVATFYHFFQLKPAGDHVCSVCTGTACYIKGADALMKTVSQEYDVVEGATTDDKRLSLLTVRCLGACGLAPAAVIDGEVIGMLTPEKLKKHLSEVMK